MILNTNKVVPPYSSGFAEGKDVMGDQHDIYSHIPCQNQRFPGSVNLTLLRTTTTLNSIMIVIFLLKLEGIILMMPVVALSITQVISKFSLLRN